MGQEQGDRHEAWIHRHAGLAGARAASLGACAGLPFTGCSSWKEEVLLHDGGTLIVDRAIVRRGRHEIGQPPPIGEQTIRFKLPRSGKTVLDQCLQR